MLSQIGVSDSSCSILISLSKCNPIDYLTKKELSNVPKEPKLALDGGKLGLEKIDELFTQISELKNTPIILLEIAPTQFKAIDYFVENRLTNKTVSLIKDLSGRDRVAIIKENPL